MNIYIPYLPGSVLYKVSLTFDEKDNERYSTEEVTFLGSYIESGKKYYLFCYSDNEKDSMEEEDFKKNVVASRTLAELIAKTRNGRQVSS